MTITLHTLDHLAVNFSLLVTLAFVSSLLLTAHDAPVRRTLWTLLHALGPIVLLTHAAPLGPGLLFDLRSAPIALATWRGGPLVGLAVSLPVALYRLHLGGPGALPALLNFALTIAVSTWLRPRLDLARFDLRRAWWLPFAVFGVNNLATFLAVGLAGKPLWSALPLYLLFGGVGALGLLCAMVVLAARLTALSHNAALAQLVTVDPLTGVGNRRAFDDDFERLPRDAALLLLDLDRFKTINDTHGHEVGDRVLSAAARAVQDAVRPGDRVYRLGGEEFAVLLHGAALASGVGERVRAAVERETARACGLAAPVTVSGGLVQVNSDRRATIGRADALLYAAKAAGRNRVFVHLGVAAAGPN